MSQSSDVVKNDVVKKAVYDKLAAKVNNIDTYEKGEYQTDKAELEQKIPHVTKRFCWESKTHWIRKQNSRC